MKKALRIATVVLLAAGVAACGGDGNSASTPVVVPPPPVTTTAKQETLFGANFATAFEASTSATPVTPADGDIIPLTLTADPVVLN